MPIHIAEVKRARGFTLVELMIIVVIIGILATLAIVRYGNVSEKAYSAEAFTALARIVSAENVFRLENNTYTTNLADLDLDVTDPNAISPNFSYDIVNIDDSCYARANHFAKPTNDYYMCCVNGRQGKTAAIFLCP